MVSSNPIWGVAGGDRMSFRDLLHKAGVKTRAAPNGEYSICCPHCGDLKFHAQVSESKEVMYCYRRGCTDTLVGLAKHFGIAYIKGFTVTESPLDDLKESVQGLSYGSVSLPRQHGTNTLTLGGMIPILGSKSMIAEKAKAYLNGRGFTDDIIDKYGLMFSESGRYAGRIIIPFYEHKKLVYFQARRFIGADDRKVINPSKDDAPRGKSHWLYNFDMASKYDEVIITEGWASAISAGENAVALQGNRASPVQMKKLLANWSRFIIILDPDTLKETMVLGDSFMSSGRNIEVKVVVLEAGDPNELGSETINVLKSSAMVYDKLNLLKRLVSYS